MLKYLVASFLMLAVAAPALAKRPDGLSVPATIFGQLCMTRSTPKQLRNHFDG